MSELSCSTVMKSSFNIVGHVMNEMTAYESALGCKEGSDGATKETEETTNKRNDEVVSGDWVANEGRGNGGLDGWGCLMVSCTLASHANLTTSYKPVSVCPFVVQGKMRG